MYQPQVNIKPDLCRVCLCDQDLLPIFNDYNDLSKSSKITACAAVCVDENDSLPAYICRMCNQVLELAYIFKTKCEETDRELRQIVEAGLERKETLQAPASVHIEMESCEPIFNNIKITFVNNLPYIPSGEGGGEGDKFASEVVFDGTKLTENDYNAEMEEIHTEKESLPVTQRIDEEILNVFTETSSLKPTPTNYESYSIEPLSPTEAVKTFLSFPAQKSTPNFKPEVKDDNINPTNYYNDDIVLGEECEVVTENVMEKLQTMAPKGRYVVIKSIIKPASIHSVPIENIDRNNEQISPKSSNNDLKKVYDDEIRLREDEANLIKNDVPEPAVYIETVTETYQSSSYFESDPLEENLPCEKNENKNLILYKTFVPKLDDDKPKKGRIKKTEKYKPPQGVSYLKSGKKPVANVNKKSIKSKSVEAGTNSKKLIRRSRVEKITTWEWDDVNNKIEETNRTLSTSLLNSEKFKKLNNPQKKVLYQRLQLESLRPTSKKDISERGVPESLPKKKLEENSEVQTEKPRAKKIGQKRSISNDLAIINGSENQSSYQNKQLQSIDQDLKVINNSLNKPSSSTEENKIPAKTGRHTAIKSKTPQKRNQIEPLTMEINSELNTRKSERQRSPKKIFPEIDVFATQKRKSDRGKKYGDSDEDEDEEKNGSATDEEEKETEKYVYKVLQKDKVELDYGSGLSCNVCRKSFPYRSHLIRHVRTHTGLKPHSCQYCQKTFSSLSSLNIHVRNHLGDFTYVCEVCQRGFVQPSVLKRHMLSHTGEHPYECEICFRTFVHDSSLKLHLKMHTVKEPQHKCDICDKKFKYRSTLTSHKKTHSGIKPFTCSECRKSFYRRSLLKRHMRSHSNERPYKCRYCKARFTYSGGLASHQKLHSGIRPFQCEHCAFSFFRKSHLVNHMKNIHNNGEVLECRECNLKFNSLSLWREHRNQKHLKAKEDDTTSSPVSV